MAFDIREEEKKILQKKLAAQTAADSQPFSLRTFQPAAVFVYIFIEHTISAAQNDLTLFLSVLDLSEIRLHRRLLIEIRHPPHQLDPPHRIGRHVSQKASGQAKVW